MKYTVVRCVSAVLPKRIYIAAQSYLLKDWQGGLKSKNT